MIKSKVINSGCFMKDGHASPAKSTMNNATVLSPQLIEICCNSAIDRQAKTRCAVHAALYNSNQI